MSTSGPKIVLIIDDLEDSREILTEYLRDLEGVSSRAFAGAEEALDYFRAGGTADLLLLDLMMPKVGGFDLLEMVRGKQVEGASVPWREGQTPEMMRAHMKQADKRLNDRIANLPVIIVSARRNKEDVLQARGYKVAGYVAKPVDEADLLRQVRQVLKI